MGKMWAGRFQKEADSKVNDFNSSISFDGRMYNCLLYTSHTTPASSQTVIISSYSFISKDGIFIESIWIPRSAQSFI